MITRRQFLASHAAGTLVSILPGIGLGRLLDTKTRGYTSLAELNYSIFDELEDRNFLITFSPNDRQKAELVEVSLKQSTPNFEQFSLVFRTKTLNAYPQGIYQLSNEVLGPFDLFIVPLSKSDSEVHYEAVFSNVVSEDAPPSAG